MGLKIDRKQDKRVVHACTHMLADIPNGVTVCSSELVAGGILQEGTALGGKDAAGFYHVVKTARLTENATAATKAYKVAKGHHFKVGDFIMLKVGAKACNITSINTSETLYDTINVDTTLGEAARGAALVLAAAESADTTSAFKYVPKAMTGDSYDVEALNNHFVTAVTIGQFKESVIPAVSDDIKAALPGISLI
ncbi:hypothetical protein K0F25_06315 [Bacteroides fragilis]|nr:hypothetical protein [Bacteroides fragilis]